MNKKILVGMVLGLSLVGSAVAAPLAGIYRCVEGNEVTVGTDSEGVTIAWDTLATLARVTIAPHHEMRVPFDEKVQIEQTALIRKNPAALVFEDHQISSFLDSKHGVNFNTDRSFRMKAHMFTLQGSVKREIVFGTLVETLQYWIWESFGFDAVRDYNFSCSYNRPSQGSGFPRPRP